MNFIENIRVALRALAANKLRSSLTMLGIIIGVAAVVALMAVGAGATSDITSSIEGLGTNMITVTSGRSFSFAGMGRGTSDSQPTDPLYYADYQAIENDVHIIGMSSLAAGHKTHLPKLIEELKKLGREDIIVICGGVIPAQDYDYLYEHGAAAIFGPGTKIPEAALKIMEILND